MLSASEHGGVREYRQVVETFTTHPDALIEVNVNSVGGLRGPSVPETILTTEEHPFYVLDETFTTNEYGRSPRGAWRGASALHPGDRVWLSDGQLGEVTRLRRLAGDPNRTLTTYNFEVSEHHTYFVGRMGVWVHNGCSKEVSRAMSRLHDIGYNEVERGQKTGFLRNWLLNKKDSDRPNRNEMGMMLHRAQMEDMADLQTNQRTLAELIEMTQQRQLRHSHGAEVLKGTKPDKDLQGKWEGHHIFPKWLMEDLGFDDVNPEHLPSILLPGGGMAKRPLWAPDPSPGSKGFADMTNGLGSDGDGYSAPFHRGEAPEGLEARLTTIREKYRNSPGLEKQNLLRELEQAMNQGSHGKMGLHSMFKSITISVLKAKDPGLIPNDWK